RGADDRAYEAGRQHRAASGRQRGPAARPDPGGRDRGRAKRPVERRQRGGRHRRQLARRGTGYLRQNRHRAGGRAERPLQHLGPAVHAARSRLVRRLRHKGKSADGGRGARRARGTARRHGRGPPGQADVRVALQAADRERAPRSEQSPDPPGHSRREDPTSRSGAEGAAGPAGLGPLMLRARALSTLDINFLGTALALTGIGCLLIYSATYFTDPTLRILRAQMLWVAIGMLLMLLFLVIDYHVFFDIAPMLYGIGVALLFYLLIWGKLTANVKSWIHIGTFQFQPSEFM